jgi:hypothetical protein
MSSHSPHSQPPQDAHDLEVGNHEPDEIAFGGILKVGVVLTVVTLASYVIVLGVFWFFDRQATANEPAPVYPMAVGLGERLPPVPRLQTTPKEDLRTLREQQQQMMEGFTWVDRNEGIVRIPIDQAIKLTLERGLPARPANVDTPAAPDAAK